MPKVSIIVPVHNTEHYLKACVDSLTAQTLTDIEIILVENCSTDNSLALCHELAKSDSRIKVLSINKADLSTARNEGVKVAIGEYIGFVDSDDYVDITMFEKLYQTHQENDVNFVVCARWNEHSSGEKDSLGPREDGILDLTTYKFPNARLGIEAPSGIVQKLYNREWLMGLEVWFPENMAYEDNFWGNIVNYYAQKVGLIKEPLYFYSWPE